MPAILIIAAGFAVGEVFFGKGLADGASAAEQKIAVGLAAAVTLGGAALLVYAYRKGAVTA